MAKKPVSIYFGVDSGGGCPCVTPPTTLSPPRGNVFVNKLAVMANGDVLTPAIGQTCSIPPFPCTSTRVVGAVNFTFVNKVSISTVGDILNPVTGITIPVGSPSVFA
ncbi:MAG: hypothetical protein ACO388_07465 [Saprospiraceae bacterium]